MKCGTFSLLFFLFNFTGCLQIVSNIELNQKSSSSSSTSSISSEDSPVDEIINIPTDPWIVQLGAVTTAVGGDNTGSERCRDTAVDKYGNVYCAGHTTGAYGETYGGGAQDAFVLKLNSSGEVEWITQLGGDTAVPGGDTSQDDRCVSVAVDDSGNVYCAGYTEGDLGEGNGGGDDVFVMKLDSNGDIVWISQLGDTTVVPGGDTTNSDQCVSVAVDDDGNVYCAGATRSDLGEGHAGNGDAFILKLNSSGAVQWITQFGVTTVVPGPDKTDQDTCYSTAVDSSGNVYCAGSTSGGLGEVNGGGGNEDLFVVKLDSNGDLVWITQFGGTTTAAGNNSEDDRCNGVDVDSSGNVYCAGETESDFDEVSAGGDDAIIIKLDSDGDLVWATHFGATTTTPANGHNLSDYCESVKVDSAGAVYCSGQTYGDLGENNGGDEDGFVMKLDSLGDLEWVRQLGDTTSIPGTNTANSEFCEGVDVDSAGNVYCAGRTSGSVGENNGGTVDTLFIKLNSDGEAN
ncbi:SBBP repeat-containing protein [Bacteriovoracaceae bacterium]|nr:SBBP repeat-containing protein [Bacteriovoracaceae bacterium]